MVTNKFEIADDLRTRFAERLGDRALISAEKNTTAGFLEVSVQPRNPNSAPIWMAVDDDQITIRVASGARVEVRGDGGSEVMIARAEELVVDVAERGFVEVARSARGNAKGFRGEISRRDGSKSIIRTNWVGIRLPFEKSSETHYEPY